MIRVIFAIPFIISIGIFIVHMQSRRKMEQLIATKHPEFIKALVIDNKHQLKHQLGFFERILDRETAQLCFELKGQTLRYNQIFSNMEVLQSFKDDELTQLGEQRIKIWSYFKLSILPATIMTTLLILEVSIA